MPLRPRNRSNLIPWIERVRRTSASANCRGLRAAYMVRLPFLGLSSDACCRCRLSRRSQVLVEILERCENLHFRRLETRILHGGFGLACDQGCGQPSCKQAYGQYRPTLVFHKADFVRDDSVFRFGRLLGRRRLLVPSDGGLVDGLVHIRIPG